MKNNNASKYTAIGLHIFTGLGALAGGMAAILNPVNPMGIPTEMLKNGPFTSYLIPGLFLFAVLGLGNIACAVLAIIKSRFFAWASGAMGGILALWIIIQCYILQEIAVLHIIFFLIGIAQGLLAIIWLYHFRSQESSKSWPGPSRSLT